MPVIEALDRVLEILRTTELYSPQFGAKDDDPHASDLVGGLMSVSRLARLLPVCSPGICSGAATPSSLHVTRAHCPLSTAITHLLPSTQGPVCGTEGAEFSR